MCNFGLISILDSIFKLGVISLLVLMISIFGCSDKDLPKYNELNSLRVLTLVADHPEVNAGDSVVITPIVSDVTENSGLTYSSFSCIDYGIALGVEPTCTGNPTSIPLQSGSISTLTVANAFTGIANTVSLIVPDAQSILALRSSMQQYNGVAYIVEYILQNSRGEQVRSFKRILVSDSAKTVKNINPDISDLLFNGSAVTSSLPNVIGISASLTFNGTPVESFQRMNNDEQLVSEIEELVTTWFITDGKLKYLRTLGYESNEYDGPAASPVGRPSYIIGVVRDGRGGAHYKIKCFGTCI